MARTLTLGGAPSPTYPHRGHFITESGSAAQIESVGASRPDRRAARRVRPRACPGAIGNATVGPSPETILFARHRRPCRTIVVLLQAAKDADDRSDGTLFALGFDANSVIHGGPDALFAAEVSFRGLD